jgi:hypothetical protein
MAGVTVLGCHRDEPPPLEEGLLAWRRGCLRRGLRRLSCRRLELCEVELGPLKLLVATLAEVAVPWRETPGAGAAGGAETGSSSTPGLRSGRLGL